MDFTTGNIDYKSYKGNKIAWCNFIKSLRVNQQNQLASSTDV